MSFKTTMLRINKPRSGIALGGLGTGSLELRQDGVFYNWSIFNNRPMNTGEPFNMEHNSVLFFVVRFQEKGKEPMMRVLQIEDQFGAAGVIDHPHYYVFPWISGVDKVTYEGDFPFVRMTFTDAQMPFDVQMEAFTPFIPHDVKNSSLPAAIFNFKIISKTANPVDVMIMASMRNAVCYDQREKVYVSRLVEGSGYRAFEMTCSDVDTSLGSYGTMGVASLSSSSTYYLGWEHRHPYYEIALRSKTLPDTDDTAGRNPVNKESGKPCGLERFFCSIANSTTLRGKKASFEHSFAATWHFPNRYAQKPRSSADNDTRIEGHYYANFFKTSADVADYVAANRSDLTTRTKGFFKAYGDSTAPGCVLDQVKSNLNTMITSSWLTKEMNFGIVEGLDHLRTYAGLDTTDVAMYGGIMTASLFPQLNRNMMNAYARFQGENGVIAHSINRNFAVGPDVNSSSERLDMPMQFTFMSLRAFFWSGDREFLAGIWPNVKKALEYVLRERDKNGDLFPEMEGVGCSYDNFPMYGVSSYIGSQWLAAVSSAIEAARILGDTAFITRYSEVLEKGMQIMDKKAWNGKYFRLYNDEGGPRGDKDEGCMADQVIGQWAAHQVGLGYILDPKKVHKGLASVMAMNYHPLYGVRNCRWPADKFLHEVHKDIWVDQANTAWTGVEMAVASLMLHEGMYDEGIAIVKNVDDRYRNWGMYWDHQEFGGHYFRPMAAWGVINGLLGLAIKNHEYSFKPASPQANQKLFFCFDGGYAHYTRKATAKKETVGITVGSGILSAHRINLAVMIKKPAKVEIWINKQPVTDAIVKKSAGKVIITFAQQTNIPSGATLSIAVS